MDQQSLANISQHVGDRAGWRIAAEYVAEEASRVAIPCNVGKIPEVVPVGHHIAVVQRYLPLSLPTPQTRICWIFSACTTCPVSCSMSRSSLSSSSRMSSRPSAHLGAPALLPELSSLITVFTAWALRSAVKSPSGTSRHPSERTMNRNDYKSAGLSLNYDRITFLSWPSIGTSSSLSSSFSTRRFVVVCLNACSSIIGCGGCNCWIIGCGGSGAGAGGTV